jgi:hypothetical protein
MACLFQRNFGPDPLQRTFMCLPRELRDMVYRFTFNKSSITSGDSHLRYSPDWDGMFNTD